MAPTVEVPAAAGAMPATVGGRRAAARRWGVASSQAAQDQLFSLLALTLWCTTCAKSALASPLLAHHNLQNLAGAGAIIGVGLAWPAAAPRSYARWRVPALAMLRFLLMALPYNFEEGVWDDVFVGAASGYRLAHALSLIHLGVGTGIIMLVLTALGWRLPLRAHMGLQAALVGLWMHLGVGPHSRSMMMTSPEVAAGVAAVYRGGEVAIAVLLPFAARPPGGPRTQAAAVLLFGWLVLGWLLPTLLLMQPGRDAAGAASQHQQQNGPPRGWLAAAGASLAKMERRLLACLRSLSPSHDIREQALDQAAGNLPPAVQLFLHWVTVLVLLWLPCRTVAPLYTGSTLV